MKNSLRGAIMAAYPSISEFARAMHWDRKKASRIVNGKQSMSSKDIEEIAALLQISDATDFVNIFFDGLSTMRTTAINPLDFMMNN